MTKTEDNYIRNEKGEKSKCMEYGEKKDRMEKESEIA
jgi:hypothetical protein